VPQMHVLNSGAGLVPMTPTPYENEDLLQKLLADHPNLMPGELVDQNNPRRWLLVTREAGIAFAGSGGNRWSLDHLFLDQEGIPTLVEVKRSTDTRARREVVAQMLDYAASLVAWGPGQMVEVLRGRCAAGDLDFDKTVEDLVGQDGENPETFWSRVDSNLASGRIRLIFLADQISPELKQIIEFLNSQFTRAEVLGIEVRQWTGQGVTTLVSTVIGRTAAAQATKSKSSTSGAPWTQSTLIDALQERCSPAEVELVERLLRHGAQVGHHPYYGAGVTPGMSYYYSIGGKPTSVWALYLYEPGARLALSLGAIAKDAPAAAWRLVQRLRTNPTFAQLLAGLTEETLPSKYPQLPLVLLAELEAREALFDAINELLEADTAQASPLTQQVL
jgi:hypothetical protein